MVLLIWIGSLKEWGIYVINKENVDFDSYDYEYSLPDIIGDLNLLDDYSRFLIQDKKTRERRKKLNKLMKKIEKGEYDKVFKVVEYEE